MRTRFLKPAFAFLLACPSAWTQEQAPKPQVLVQEALTRGAERKQTIGPGAVHRYPVPAGGLFLHVLVNQISADVVLRIARPDGTVQAMVDATNLGWESLPVVLPEGGGFLDLSLREKAAKGGRYELTVQELRPPEPGDAVHAAAALAATEARSAAAPGTTGAIEASVHRYERVLALWRESRDRHGELMTLLSLATLAYAGSRYSEGAEHSARALELARALHDRGDEGLAANNRATCELALGMPNDARLDLAVAAEAFAETGSLFAVAAAKLNLGTVDFQSGRWSDSVVEYGEARALAHQIAEQRLEAYALDHIAADYIALGDFESAASFLEQALAVFRAYGDRQAEARCMATLGRLRFQTGRVQEAERILRDALERLHTLADRRAEADGLNSLGQVLEKSSPAESRAAYEKALALYQAAEDRRGEASIYCNLGRFLVRQGDAGAGIDFLNRSLAIRRTMAVFDLEAEALYALAEAERVRGDAPRALAYVEQAIKIFESARQQAPGEWFRSNYLASRGDAYHLAIALHLESFQRDPASHGDVRAFETHERVLARSLVDRLGISWDHIVRGVDQALLARARQLEILIAFRSSQVLHLFERPHKPQEEQAARSRLEVALAEYRLVQAQIRGASQEYRRLVEPEPPTLREIQQSLVGKSGVLLEFWLGEPGSYVWAVSDTGFRGYPLPSGAQIEGWAVRFLSGLSSGNPRRAEDVTAAGRALGELLKQPLADAGSKKRLWVVAQGTLARVPFAAIQMPSRPREAAHYLVESWEVSMLPSAHAGLQLRLRALNRAAPGRGIAVLADPVFSANDERMPAGNSAGTEKAGLPPSARYPRLAFTRLEAQAILASAPSKSNLLALDFDANATTAKKALGAYRYVHFSTHAEVDVRNPELSGMVLSMVDRSGKVQDGILRLTAILEMPLRAELVVLSACGTAAGAEIPNEGILGLTQGFVYAGAQQVISSAWPVEDFGAREFMKRFYEALLLRGMKPAAALRAAQLALMKTRAFGMPQEWAAFMIYGCGG